jgi:hypothetical protein
VIRLSPAYDINPSVDRNELSLAICETETRCDVSVAMNTHKTYGISGAQADAALNSVETAVAMEERGYQVWHSPGGTKSYGCRVRMKV